ncbi:ACP S-malonyltransferase [Streptomyces tuirus]|uniref:[acyl-carrier-protein] S-malonyltransferase n=1 Tax=Streptomyces tuirus TaxID=68278 RepID=A0A941FE10_9ACTN|nr:ACP S-malonyltransferase [Streptomyces tuirus]
MLVMVAPGQGAQIPGFLTPWLEEPEFADHLHWLSMVSGIDLAYFGTEAEADAIRDTAIAQPLIVATGLVAAHALFPDPIRDAQAVDIAAGHSLGEITIAAGVGMISAEQAMVLVRERGKAMAETAAKTESGMIAILGGEAEEVSETLLRHNLAIVNDNGPGQVVAAGAREDINRLIEDPPSRTRLRPLEIAGAFHTKEVDHVADLLSRCARAISPLDPATGMLSNRDGRVVRDGREMLDLTVRQVSLPVHWNRCMETMVELGVTGFLELAPATTLTRIAWRQLPGVETFMLNTPDQLDDARAFVDKHSGRRGAGGGASSPS